MTKIERNCMYCVNFRLDEGGAHYSELTPGYEALMECVKGLIEIDLCDISQTKFCETMMTARTCPEFALNPAITAPVEIDE